MKVLGLAGYSNAGKTTLAAALIPALQATGARVSAVKHAHQHFDIDHPGKDSHRLREAGAFEVLVASGARLALMREFEQPVQWDVDRMLAQIAEPADRPLWVLVEGFRHGAVLKLELWDAAAGRPALYPEDPYVVALVTDAPETLPEPTGLPVFGRGDAARIVDWLVGQGTRFDYTSPWAEAPLPAA